VGILEESSKKEAPSPNRYAEAISAEPTCQYDNKKEGSSDLDIGCFSWTIHLLGEAYPKKLLGLLLEL
jgi:hypothetical protein